MRRSPTPVISLLRETRTAIEPHRVPIGGARPQHQPLRNAHGGSQSERVCLVNLWDCLAVGLVRRPRQRVEVCAIAMCVYFVVVIINIMMMNFFHSV